MMALTCKQLARAWGIAVTKVTQAREPTFRKMARAMLMFPTETMAELSEEMARQQELEPITPAELWLREDMMTLRVDRQRIHPETTKRSAAQSRRSGPSIPST